MARIAALTVLVALFGAAPTVHAAGPYDPALDWRTFETARFRVHYPEGSRNLAIRIGRIGEEVLDDVAALFGNMPRRPIDVILSDASDRANGSAGVLPKNTLRLYLAAPTELTGLSSYDDWLRILMIHEIAHLADIDQVGGFTEFLRLLFGSYIQWNGFAPQFLSEGVAVYAETVLTPTGRGRSSYIAMLLRMAALEDRFLPIDQAHVAYPDWPGGNVAYYYGGTFHLWLADKYGSAAVAELHERNARALLPYIYYPSATATFGMSLPDLWEEWRKEELAVAREVEAAVRAAGVSESRALTDHGRNLSGSVFEPDGASIVYSRSSPVDGSTVRRLHADGSETVLVKQTYSPRFSFFADGKSFVYSQNAINERFNDFADLYRYDIASNSTSILRDAAAPTKSLRARDPTVSPDGSRVVFVRNRLHQSWLSVGLFTDLDEGEMRIRDLVPAAGDMQHASPRFSPDGKLVAVSTWFPGGARDIVLVDADTGALVRRLTADTAQDGSPAFSPDGRYVLWESDHDGISNIYAYDMQEQSYLRVTRVVGGAFQPEVSPDATRLIFRNASGRGFDIHEMPFAPERWEALTYSPERGFQPVPTPVPSTGAWTRCAWPAGDDAQEAGQSRDREAPIALAFGERDTTYTPWDTLLPSAANWAVLPTIFMVNGFDPTLQLRTFGFDALAEHTWFFTASTSWYTRQPSFAIGYTNDRWYPSISIGYSDDWRAYQMPEELEGFTDEAAVLRRSRRGLLSVALPVGQRHLIAASYAPEHRTAPTQLDRQLLDLDRVDDFASVEVGYRYTYTRAYPYSVSPEDGVSIAATGRWYDRALGADFDELLVGLDARGYINNPLFDNHVLALRLAAAVALGPDFEETFELGGAQGDSIFSIQTERTYPLRGFELDLRRYPAGVGLLAGYAEYRMPLLRIDRGLWTLPFTFEKVHLAIFVEAGNTIGRDLDDLRHFGSVAARALSRLRSGAGAELRADFLLGWAFPLTVRLGAAYPWLVDGNLGRGELPEFYWSLGSAL